MKTLNRFCDFDVFGDLEYSLYPCQNLFYDQQLKLKPFGRYQQLIDRDRKTNTQTSTETDNATTRMNRPRGGFSENVTQLLDKNVFNFFF